MLKRIAIFHPAARDHLDSDLELALQIMSEFFEVVQPTVLDCSKTKREEFMSLVCDDTIDLLMAWRGGKIGEEQNLSRTSLELVNSLTEQDWTVIKQKSPKIVGRSDITFLTSALCNDEIPVYYGPCLQSALAAETSPDLIRYMLSSMDTAMFGSFPYTIDFSVPPLCTNTMSTPWTLSSGIVTGRLVGGNLDTIFQSYKYDFAQNTIPQRSPGDILFIEENDPCYSKLYASVFSDDELGKKFEYLNKRGFFEHIHGLVIGRSATPCFLASSSDDFERPYIEKILSTLGLSNIPILANIACSHTSPMVTLPLGAIVTLDADRQTLTVHKFPSN